MTQAVQPVKTAYVGRIGITVSVEWARAAGISLAFLGGFIVALFLLFTTEGFISNDDYYHSRLASEMIEQRSLRVIFPWLPLTILNADQFVDHHLLYHILVAPFAHWGGIEGAKLAQSIIVGAVFAMTWVLLRQMQVHSVWFWLLLLLGLSTPFLYRLLMVRAQGAAVLMLLCALSVLFSRRYRWLVPISFVFVWLYNGFILLTAFAVVYMVSAWVTERRIIWQPLIYTLLGTAAGLVINPYFPQNIAFILDHLGEKVDVAASVRVGSEWYPYTTEALMQNSLGMLVILVSGILAPSLRRTGRDHIETTLLLTALMTLYMTFESRRFIEYAPIFVLLFAAAALGRQGIQWDQLLPTALKSKQQMTYLFRLMLLIPALGFAWQTIQTVQQDIQDENPGYMRGAADWLEKNTQPGEMIFQTDWDDFTYLFFHNTHNRYLVGLDPTYLQVADPSLWNLWVSLTQGEVENPSAFIRQRFDASYVVSDTRHADFEQMALRDSAMTLVYEDDNSLIWQINDAETAD
jgi:hypothetical protein